MNPNEKCDSMPVSALKSDLTAKYYRVSDKQFYDIYKVYFCLIGKPRSQFSSFSQYDNFDLYI